MRHVDIACVLFISCVPSFLYVGSQTSCPTGWFGSNCRYKCRCNNNKCNPFGYCVDSYTCQDRWFGPACQYVDLAYEATVISEITDGNDNTCMTRPGVSNVDLLLNNSWPLTWLRVHVNKNITDIQNRLNMTFKENATSLDCNNLRIYFFDDKTADIHCNVTQNINRVLLSGDAVQELCSVYISGERNVALKEKAVQSSTHSESSVHTINVNITFNASIAVDGIMRSELYDPPYCASTQNLSNSSWELHLSKARRVNRYTIYNRGASYRIIGFRLESFDSNNNSSFQFTDATPLAFPAYYLSHAPAEVQLIRLLPSPTETTLILCEMEVYGDSICEAGKYGLDCENECHCLNTSEQCAVSTGGCLSGCAAGYKPPGCIIQCADNMYGLDCQQPCSKRCAPASDANRSLCRHDDGFCLHGCVPGYTGAMCTESCPNDMYGQHCHESCVWRCTPSPDASSCHHINGSCLNGCRIGFIWPPSCNEKCAKDKYGKDCRKSCSKNCLPSKEANESSCDFARGICLYGCKGTFVGSYCAEESMYDVRTEYIVGICLAAAILFFVLYCLCRKKTDEVRPEGPPKISRTKERADSVTELRTRLSRVRVSKLDTFADNEFPSAAV